MSKTKIALAFFLILALALSTTLVSASHVYGEEPGFLEVFAQKVMMFFSGGSITGAQVAQGFCGDGILDVGTSEEILLNDFSFTFDCANDVWEPEGITGERPPHSCTGRSIPWRDAVSTNRPTTATSSSVATTAPCSIAESIFRINGSCWKRPRGPCWRISTAP